VVKHAGATKITLSAEVQEGELRIVVADDGRGFDATAPATGFGLVGMRERVELAGGRIAISDTGAGTRVDVALPVLPRP
jgi:two-component system, NarL family, sensor histidine kinase UhpB